MHHISLDPLDEFPCPDCGTPLDASHAQPFSNFTCPQCGNEGTVPGKFGPFMLLREQGQSATGTLQDAFDPKLGRHVSLKILNSVFSSNNDLVAAFKKEALAAASMNSLHVLKVYEFGVHNRQPYMVMEHMQGQFLNEVLEKGALDQGNAIRLTQGIVEGLCDLQQQGIIHGEVMPRNILLHKDGKPRFSDFGLARLDGEDDEHAQSWSSPYYMPPERILNQPEDFRGDFYSLGVTLFYMVTGTLPFFDLDEEETKRKKCTQPAPDPGEINPDLHPSVVGLVNSLLQANPEDRPGSFEELTDHLNNIAGHFPDKETVIPPAAPWDIPVPGKPQSRREAISWFVFLTLAGVLSAILLSYFTKNPPPTPSPLPTATPHAQSTEATPVPTTSPTPLPTETPTPPPPPPTPTPQPIPTPAPLTLDEVSDGQILLFPPQMDLGMPLSEWYHDNDVIFLQDIPERQPTVIIKEGSSSRVLAFDGHHMFSSIDPTTWDDVTLVVAAQLSDASQPSPQLIIGVDPHESGWTPFGIFTVPSLPGVYKIQTARGTATVSTPRTRRGRTAVFGYRKKGDHQEIIFGGRRITLPNTPIPRPTFDSDHLSVLHIGGASNPDYDMNGWIGAVYLADRVLTDSELTFLIREFQNRFQSDP